ncbi:aldo-keto reductase domain-containing protein [Chloropicon primus]|uniref:NADP-dependent oxidoreductase domain-containing protein n=1 Tax=Chloropicon primus TaxID=1764295 RepID=A0A5B8MPZ1_9CHLO|nr:hypothetical protein A3770_08p50250 [Chloropicon primus]UPR01728.1 aldo-keto reductase domain-containing protein [Chloropicon primus]|eukprot:QDZ22507.1 hypothetical protein A3770_08p50250 [Chloropicon primus]
MGDEAREGEEEEVGEARSALVSKTAPLLEDAASKAGLVLLCGAIAVKCVRSMVARFNRLQLRGTSKGKGDLLEAKDILLGGSAFAGMFQPISEEEVFLVLKEALDCGVCHIDTAPHYGLGLSEERIGSCLRKIRMMPNSLTRKAEKVKVYTKVGRLIRGRGEVGKTIDESEVQWDNVAGSEGCIFKGIPEDRVAVLDYSAEGARTSFKESEERIDGHVYGLRVHDCETEEILARATATGKAAGALAGLGKLKREGKVGSIGIGVNDPEFALRALKSSCGYLIDTVMIAGSWNLLDQSAHDLLLYCQRHGVEVHNAGVFASGLIMGGNTVRYAPAQRAMVDKARRWRVLCQNHGTSIAAVALAFAFLPKCVKKVAIGVKSVAELKESLGSLGSHVPKELWLDAKREGLVSKHLFFH